MGYFEPKKVDNYLSKFSHHSCFLLTYMSLTPMVLIVSKQGWCHFEALECIFHLNLKKIPSVNQLTHNQQNTAFPNIWSTLYTAFAFPSKGCVNYVKNLRSFNILKLTSSIFCIRVLRKVTPL